MKRFNIVVPKKYTKDGEEKTQWNTIGTLVHFPASASKDEGFIMELSMFPNTTFKVFEQKAREDSPRTQTRTAPPATRTAPESDPADPDLIEYPEEDINPEDIPF